MHTVKLLLHAPGVYLNTDLETPAFNGDPASIRTPASRLEPHAFTYFVPMFLVYVNFTLHVNSQRLYLVV